MQKQRKPGSLILVTGGARSGKSAYAEELVKTFGKDLLYIATAIPFDEEMTDRIGRHRERRGGDFHTLERYAGFDAVDAGIAHGRDGVLFDCVTIMITNVMMDYMRENLGGQEELTVHHGNLMEERVFR